MKKLCFGILFLILSCNVCNEKHIADTSCFKKLQISILKESTKKINFSKQINCFEWDSLEIGYRGSYENYPCSKFHQIDKKYDIFLGRKLENHMDWLDRDRHWTFLYFYKNGMILNDVLAIPESVASFHELKENNGSDNLFYKNENTEFRITDFVYGGISGKELQNHRQILK
jgi:hypothetical protein